LGAKAYEDALGLTTMTAATLAGARRGRMAVLRMPGSFGRLAASAAERAACGMMP
jgi:hypothetical protein